MPMRVLAIWECSYERPFGDEVVALVPVRLVMVLDGDGCDADGDGTGGRCL